jgi:hypothetical protein
MSEREIEALKQRVRVLERAVALLARVITDEGLGSARNVRNELQALGRLRAVDDVPTIEDEEADTAPAIADASPYRGAMASGAGLLRCRVCGKTIDPDDPDLTLRKAGRVCVVCFQRDSGG